MHAAVQGKRKRDEPADSRNISGLETPKKLKTTAIQDGHVTREYVASSLPSPERSAEDVAIVNVSPLAVATECVDQAALEQFLSPDSLKTVASTSPASVVESLDHLFRDPPDSPRGSIFSLFNDTAGDDALESIATYMHTNKTKPIVSDLTQVAQNARANLFAANPNDIPSFDDWVAEEARYRQDPSITDHTLSTLEAAAISYLPVTETPQDRGLFGVGAIVPPDNVAPKSKKRRTSFIVSSSNKCSPMVQFVSQTPVVGFQNLPSLPLSSTQQIPPTIGNGDTPHQTQSAQSVQQIPQQRTVQTQVHGQRPQSKHSRNESLEFQKSAASSHQRSGSSHFTPQTPEARPALQKSPQYVPLSPQQMSRAFDHWLEEEFPKAHGGRLAEGIQELYNWGHITLVPEFTSKYGRQPNSQELQDLFIQRKVAHGMWLEDKNREQYNLSQQHQTPTSPQCHQTPFIGHRQLVSDQGPPQRTSRQGQQRQIISPASQYQPLPQQSRQGQQQQMGVPQFSSYSDPDFTDSINNMTLDQLKQQGTIMQARMHPDDRNAAQKVAQIAELCMQRNQEEQLSHEYTPQQVQQNINQMRTQQVQGNMSPRLTAALVQALNVRKLQEARMQLSLHKLSPEKTKENTHEVQNIQPHGNRQPVITQPLAFSQAKVGTESPQQQQNGIFDVNTCTPQEAHHRMAQLKTAIDNGNKTPLVAQQLAFLQQKFLQQSTPTQQRDPVNNTRLSPHLLQRRIAEIKHEQAQGLQHPATAHELAILQKRLWDFLQQIPGNELSLQHLQLKIDLLRDFQARNPQRQDVGQTLTQHLHHEKQLRAHIQAQKEEKARKTTKNVHSAQQHSMTPQQMHQIQQNQPTLPPQGPIVSFPESGMGGWV